MYIYITFETSSQYCVLTVQDILMCNKYEILKKIISAVKYKTHLHYIYAMIRGKIMS